MNLQQKPRGNSSKGQLKETGPHDFIWICGLLFPFKALVIWEVCCCYCGLGWHTYWIFSQMFLLKSTEFEFYCLIYQPCFIFPYLRKLNLHWNWSWSNKVPNIIHPHKGGGKAKITSKRPHDFIPNSGSLYPYMTLVSQEVSWCCCVLGWHAYRLFLSTALPLHRIWILLPDLSAIN